MFTRLIRWHCMAIVGVSLCALHGCVERKEHLSITPGGVVLYQIKYRSDSLDDLTQGDAIPRAAHGWLVKQEQQQDEQGKVTHRLIAENVFNAANLPAHYGHPNEADGEISLQFPSSLTIERRNDGEYYHFARTYRARSWMRIAALEEELVTKPLKSLEGIDVQDWTPQERLTAVRAFAAFETEKLVTFARDAFRKTTPEGPQDGWLALQKHLREFTSALDYSALLELLEPRATPEEQAAVGEAFEVESKKFQDNLHAELKSAARTLAGYNGAQTSSFMHEVDRLVQIYEITKDLGDEQFEIQVEMPGQIVASNADTINGSTAGWSFEGTIIRDREIELLVTSRVPFD